eukprot:Opistho-2@47042
MCWPCADEDMADESAALTAAAAHKSTGQQPQPHPMHAREGRSNQRFDNGIRQVAGCVAVRDGTHVLLVTSRNIARPKSWILPKGGWENDESVEEAALRETWEEGGVKGEITAFLGAHEKIGKRKQQRFHMYELKVTEEHEQWPEMKKRQRKWFTFTEAVEACDRPAMIQVIR